MEIGEEFKFHNRYDLKGLVYNLQQISKNSNDITSISKRITNLGGVIKTPNNRNFLIFREFHLVYQRIQ